jgi:hypothetical protein
VFSLGNSVVESPCAVGGSVIGRVSVADASLSLSLSLWDGRSLAASPTRRGFAARLAGCKARLGFSRVVGVLSASCSSAVAGCVPVAVLCCPGSGGSCPGVCEEGLWC